MPEMSEREQVALARLRLQLARQAYARGSIAEARRALLTLAATDFAGGAPVSRDPLAVLRDHRASDQDVRDAVLRLIELRPRGAP